MKLETGLRVLSACGLAAAVALGQTSDVPQPVRPSSCSGTAGVSSVLAQDNVWCGAMNQMSSKGSVETCCASEAGDDQRRLLEAIGARDLKSKKTAPVVAASVDPAGIPGTCRAFESSAPYCDEAVTPGCTSFLSEKDVMTIDLDMENTGTAGTCCATCTCYGDPECVSFDGTRDEWILCDGRNRKCAHSKNDCVKQIDHAGNKCKWLKGKGWQDFSRSGSPCQPNWAVSGYPSMTMYEADGFQINLELNERGVISKVMIVGSNQVTYSMTAESCFNSDPRVTDDASSAWEVSGADSLPSSWGVVSRNELQILWRTQDAVGILTEIVCTKSVGSTRPRLNIQRVVETAETRTTSGGFCKTGKISEKSGTTDVSSVLHDACLRRNLPDMLTSCKALVDPSCTTQTINANTDLWCESADLGNTEVAGDVEACKNSLRHGTPLERIGVWAQYICEANQLDPELCMNEIAQFGWEWFLSDYGNGMVDSSSSTCVSDASTYTKVTDACVAGIAVEYFKDNAWTQAFFIPSTMPPCNNELKLNAAAFPELFMYKVRFSECDLDAVCQLSNSCMPAMGFSVAFTYTTSDCPTPAPTASPTCATAVTPGGGEGNTVEVTPDGSIEIVMTAELNSVTCRDDDASTNVYQVGCEGSPTFTMDIKNCKATPVFTVYTVDGSATSCEGPDLPINDNTDIQVVIRGGAMSVYYGANLLDPVCTKQLPALPKGGKDICVYESAPNRPAADVCFTAGLVVDDNSESCFTCVTPPNQQMQKICEIKSESEKMGTCESCCTAESGILSPSDDKKCRQLGMDQPYCDEKTNGALCKKLSKNSGSGKLIVKVNIEDDTSLQCCKSCTCYGDPECVAFDGSQDKWILCDGRDDTCFVSSEVCGTQKDHVGRTCAWNQNLANQIGNKRADIGAIGSPCQPDWAASGDAYMTMYTVAGFSARISMGERGVIETLELTTASGVYTLVADRCFQGNGLNAWEPLVGNALDVKFLNGASKDERLVEILDPVTGIYLRVTCIKATSSNKKIVGYRMNINNLIETNPNRVGSGYCAAGGDIEKGLSTTDSTDLIFEKCQQGMDDAHLTCKALTNPSCTTTQVASGIAAWCAAANLPITADACIAAIGKSSAKWEAKYCEAISPKRPDGMSKQQWIVECTAEVQVNGIESFVSQYGKGVVSNGANAKNDLCAASETDYKPRTAANACTPGISVEYQKPNGVWVESFFIPANFPPCNGMLEISAKKHYNLFTKPMRFRQCEVDSRSCPVTTGCLPNYGFEIEYLFTQNPSICPESR